MCRNKRTVLVIVLTIAFLTIPSKVWSAPTNGPLEVHPTNGRYFADAAGDAVYLTGSHIWNNLMDWGNSYPPSALNFTAHLNLLKQHNHNFIRGWVWETTVLWGEIPKVYFYPFLFERPGPGTAHDGRPKFDLTQTSSTYLSRLRQRVIQARDEGIYIGVMLLEPINYGKKSSDPPDNQMSWWTHPFQRDNNINGIDGDPDGDGEGWETSSLPSDTYYSPRISQAVTDLQEDYVSDVIDYLHDLDNIIWEIGNEGNFESYNWQVHFINFIKNYEQSQGYMRHPVWLSAMVGTPSQNAQVNGKLFNSPAEVISPNNRDGYPTNPPANNGSKVIVLDTDHICGVCQSSSDTTVSWCWKSFTRGHQIAFMDSYYNDNPWGTNQPHHDALRYAMGDTRSYAERTNLAAMTPQNALSSTGFCLANPGTEYIVYQPAAGAQFTLNLQAGLYGYEWFNTDTHTVEEAGNIDWSGGTHSFTPPFSNLAVLFLHKNLVAPVAVINANPTNGISPLTVNFDGTGSYDTDGGNIVSYEWDFTDDGVVDSTGSITAYTYHSSGPKIYTARLTGTDNDSNTGTATVDITVNINQICDFDNDTDVDQEDFGHFQACMTGTGNPQNQLNCLDTLLDGDNDVDLDDFNVFQGCMSGANVPANPNCATN
ncbi:MAG: PKD domain-containing protein [Planctomycetota bacterium]